MNKLRSLGLAAGLAAFGAGTGSAVNNYLKPVVNGHRTSTSIIGRIQGVEARESLCPLYGEEEIRDANYWRPARTIPEHLRGHFGDLLLIVTGVGAGLTGFVRPREEDDEGKPQK